jgi:cell division control protein 45
MLPHPDCRWYIIDSHRPYRLENVVEADDKVFVLHDGEANRDLEELRDQVDILAAEESDDDESDEEEEPPPPSKRSRLSIDQYEALTPEARAYQRSTLRRLARRYYSASWHGTASSLIVYTLVQALNRTCNELLWLSILGLTDQFVHERVEYERYTEQAQLLQDEVAGLNQDGLDEQVEVKDADSGLMVPVRQHLSSRMKLDAVQELRVTLMRQWSLYEALYHSSYIATRLGLYKQDGRQKLDLWLARMGVPLEECKQEFAYMRKEFKDELFDNMEKFGPEFGLYHLTYPSFRRVTQYTTQLAAADLVTCVTATLEDALHSADEPADEFDRGGAAFAAARDTLCNGGAKECILRESLDRAKEVTRLLVAQGHAIITQRMYDNLGDFYQVVLQPGGESSRFLHQQTLTKLALFVADALCEGNVRQNRDAKPLVLAVPDSAKGTHLVVAVLGSSRYWKGSGRNAFGNAFHLAATSEKAHIAHDGFESSVCKIASGDLKNFLEGVVLRYNAAVS